MTDMLSKVKTSACNTLDGILEQSRLLAYNDVSPHGFSLCLPSVLQRLRSLEKLWVAGAQLGEIDEAFWDACYERHHRPLNFIKREKYLSLAAKAEVAKLAVEAAARMDEAAERAETDIEKSNDAISPAMGELDSMGLEQSDRELAVQLEKAMMADWDYEAVQAASRPPAQESHFKRPPLSACTSTKRRAAFQLGRDQKRHHGGDMPADVPAPPSTTASGTRTVAKPRSRQYRPVSSFALVLRPKTKPSSKASGIGSRTQARS